MKPRPTQPRLETFRLPLLSFIYAVCWAGVALWLLNLGARGLSWGPLAAWGAAGMALWQLVQMCDDLGKLWAYRRRRRAYDKSSRGYGTAAFATWQDVKRAGLNVATGVFLGTLEAWGKQHVDIRYNLEASGSIISPAGGGKTAGCLIPTLLTDPGTHVVFDPTLDIYSVTHRRRRELGNEVALVCPWPHEAARILGYSVEDVCMNFLASIDFEGQPATIREQIKNRVELVMPDLIRTDAKTRFFEREGRALLEFLILRELNCGREVTWPRVRELLLSGPAVLHDLFIESMESDAFAGELALLANCLFGVLTAAPQQFAGGFGSAAQAIELMDGYSPVSRHVTGKGFDPQRLTSGRPITVYVCYPGTRIQTHARLATATMTYLFQQVCQSAGGNRVTALVDEAAELDCPYARFMNIGRKFNLRIICAWQELHGQATERFSAAGVRQLLTASDLLWVSALRGNETCEIISKMLGCRGIDVVSLNDRPHYNTPMPDQTLGRGHHTAPLLRPDELQRLPADKAIAIVGANKPLLLNKILYFRRQDLRKVAGRNPYRDGA